MLPPEHDMLDLTTAVVIAAPHSVLATAVPIMLQYAPNSLVRFRPHITLMFPFVPFYQADSACERLYALCAKIAPFDVTLDGYGEFPGVIYMKPVNPDAIRAVFRKLYNAFPDYPPYEGQFGHDLKPHMTLVTFDPDSERPLMPMPRYEPVTFRVDRLHMWYGARHADLPWLTHDVFPLRG
jgi:2'-5' RNA ligase